MAQIANVKSKFTSVVNHVRKNRARYATLTTLAVCYAISRGAVNEWNDFLQAKGLTDEFYFDELI